MSITGIYIRETWEIFYSRGGQPFIMHVFSGGDNRGGAVGLKALLYNISMG